MNILAFAGHIVSVTISQLDILSWKLPSLTHEHRGVAVLL